MSGESPYLAARSGRLAVDDLPAGDDVGREPKALAHAVAAARRGKTAGWDWLFERFHPQVRAYALARLGDWAAADDVTQDTFVAAVRSIGSLRDDREPAVEAWFLHICRHKVVDHLRGRRRHERLVAIRSEPPVDPTLLAETHLRAAQMRVAMESLTEDQRDILIRRFVLDQSLEDVAAATGRTVGAVKSMQHRALASLERILAAEAVA